MPLQKPEVRHDLIHDRFVIIAPKMGVRPNDVERRETAAPKRESSKNCPFCNEPLTAENTLLAMCGRKHWCVRVVQNKFPAVTLDNPKAYGTQEVVIETPVHDIELADVEFDHILHIFRAYQDRTQSLMKNKKIKYILIFKNQGGKAGASLRHAHSHQRGKVVRRKYLHVLLENLKKYIFGGQLFLFDAFDDFFDECPVFQDQDVGVEYLRVKTVENSGHFFLDSQDLFPCLDEGFLKTGDLDGNFLFHDGPRRDNEVLFTQDKGESRGDPRSGRDPF